MSSLLGDHIREAMGRPLLEDRLVITPLLEPSKQIGPGSVDLRLGTEFLELNRAGQTLLDPALVPEAVLPSALKLARTYVPLGEGIVIHPGQFLLGATLEFISLPKDINGQVVSRSSWGRLGLLVATAVAVHPGFKGMLTLELVNTGTIPIMLRAGARVAQLQLWTASNANRDAYRDAGKYTVPVGPETARLDGERSEGAKMLRLNGELAGR